MEYLPKKSLGQHWLNDAASLDAMVEAAEITSHDIILEIGSGPGSLTALLTRQAKKVIAVEKDNYLAAQLTNRVKTSNLEVFNEDILSFKLTNLPPGYKLVANIPYYLTSNLIRVISETPNSPLKAVLLIQKEVAQRIAARPGQMSLLSVTAQYYWEVSLNQLVPAHLFTPPPKVDSQIVVLSRRSEPLFISTDPPKYFQIVRAGFSQRRKTLVNSLSASLQLDRAVVSKICAAADIDPKRRAQTLSLEEWQRLYEKLDVLSNPNID